MIHISYNTLKIVQSLYLEYCDELPRRTPSRFKITELAASPVLSLQALLNGCKILTGPITNNKCLFLL